LLGFQIFLFSVLDNQKEDMNMEHLKPVALRIWKAGVDAVRPSTLVKKFLDSAWSPADQTLVLNGESSRFRLDGNCYVVG
jgi:hypothetical protein